MSKVRVASTNRFQAFLPRIRKVTAHSSMGIAGRGAQSGPLCQGAPGFYLGTDDVADQRSVRSFQISGNSTTSSMRRR